MDNVAVDSRMFAKVLIYVEQTDLSVDLPTHCLI